MTPYKNSSGSSGVRAFSVSDDSITVEFEDGGTYRYTTDSAGEGHIAQMQRLALAGRGLCTYISRNVRHRYAAKLR